MYIIHIKQETSQLGLQEAEKTRLHSVTSSVLDNRIHQNKAMYEKQAY